MSGLSPRQVRNAWSTLVATKNYNHLQPFPRHWVRKNQAYQVAVKAAKPKDRIKYWNIAPGDKVRVRGHKFKGMLEVVEVNKISNRVRLRPPTEDTKNVKDEDEPSWINVHYSRLQLFIRMHTFPGRKEASPVYATRLGKTSDVWNKTLRQYTWHRYPLATTPRLPPKLAAKMIPWPSKVKKDERDPNEIYDTAAEAVAEVTYELPLEADLKRMATRAVENAYVRSLYNPFAPAYQVRSAVETQITRELSNPHSRAKQQARWKARQQYKKDLLADMVRAEIADLKGRTRREARAEAAWKWKQRLDAEDRAERLRRRVVRGDEAKTVARRARKVRKEAQRAKVLEKLVLVDAPNQFVPPQQPAANTPA